MNNLVENGYVLRRWWGGIRDTIYKYNIKYLILPVIYLLMISMVVPQSNELVNKVSYTALDSYNSLEISVDKKLDYILEKYNLTNEQFKVLTGIVLSEADHTYEDAYAVINTIYNRTHSKSWVKTASKKFGKEKGDNLYYQAILPNQFVVYQHGHYLKKMNNTDSAGYQAIIDFLFTEDIMHNYLSFRAHSINVSNSVTFSARGNRYFNILSDKNRI